MDRHVSPPLSVSPSTSTSTVSMHHYVPAQLRPVRPFDLGALSPNSARLNAIYNQIISRQATTNGINEDRRLQGMTNLRPAVGGAGGRQRSPSWASSRASSEVPPDPVPPLTNRNYQEARYKTELCLHYREKNSCPHGSRCLFAHGLAELRPYRGRHPKHKTQPCKSFHEKGYCNYGYRCSYIHMESPRTIRYIKSLNDVAQQCRKYQKRQLVNSQRSRSNSLNRAA